MKSQLFAPEIDNFIDNINRETAPINHTHLSINKKSAI
jgi:hypothetical protein